MPCSLHAIGEYLITIALNNNHSLHSEIFKPSANQKQELSIEEMFLLDQDETGKYCRGPKQTFCVKMFIQVTL